MTSASTATRVDAHSRLSRHHFFHERDYATPARHFQAGARQRKRAATTRARRESRSSLRIGLQHVSSAFTGPLIGLASQVDAASRFCRYFLDSIAVRDDGRRCYTRAHIRPHERVYSAATIFYAFGRHRRAALSLHLPISPIIAAP